MQLALQGQPATHAKQKRPKQTLHQFGKGCIGACMIGSFSLLQKELLLTGHPAMMNMAEHAHRLNHLCVTNDPVSISLRTDRTSVCCDERFTDTALINHANHKLYKSAGNGKPAESGCHQKDNHQNKQGKRCINKGEESRRGQKFTKGLKVTQSLCTRWNVLNPCRKNGAEHTLTQLLVEIHACVMHNLAAYPLKRFKQHIDSNHKKRKHKQRCMTAAVNHTVVHLHHIGAWRKHKHIDNKTEIKSPGDKGGERSKSLA